MISGPLFERTGCDAQVSDTVRFINDLPGNFEDPLENLPVFPFLQGCGGVLICQCACLCVGRVSPAAARRGHRQGAATADLGTSASTQLKRPVVVRQ
jgi:hypothetical protein